MPIHVLPDDVVSQIAAGEVVERPASVVKELVENAIDAGARDIRVEARAGGMALIRVSDDGIGIPRAEAEVAFRRHSTSKLTTAEDLSHIRTLGFRGEALSSIAAVSRMTLDTRAQHEDVGTRVRVEAGRVASRHDTGRPPGTAVTMEDLFYNVPARRKFLRTVRTERGHIDAFITRYAMAYPAIRFTLVHGGKTAFQSPGNGRLRDVVIAVYGLEIGAAVLDILPGAPVPGPAIEVTGLVSPPSLHRANRGFITLFVNGRWIRDARITYAVIQAYHTMLPAGRYPLGIVMITMSPEDVDVNVHPTKAEVRFRSSDAVFRAVQKAVRNTLLDSAPVPAMHDPLTWANVPRGSREERRERLMGLRPRSAWQRPSQPAPVPARAPGSRLAGLDDGGLPPLRVIGQVGATYIIAEGPGGLFLIDQHAAHERILFEQMMAGHARAEVVSQTLLEPRTVDLSPEAAAALAPHLDTLTSLGFQAESFGGMTMLVRAIPAVALRTDPAQVLEDVAHALTRGSQPLDGTAEETIARQVCKQAAIKAGQPLARDEMEALVRDLELCASPRTCPHGRPTMIHLSVEQLAREFGR
jgi:DNA mismatch repair protein MutL